MAQGGADHMNAIHAWTAICGQQHGAIVAAAMAAVGQVPPEVFRDARERIENEIMIGPLVRPSQYLDGRCYKNAAGYVAILEALQTISEICRSSLAGEPAAR